MPDHLGALERIAADTGYFSEQNVEEATDRQITPYIATGRPKHHPGWAEWLADPGSPPEEATPVQAMKWRLKTKEGRAFNARRKSTVEPVFGIIKRAMGFRQFLLRGLEKVNGEWKLIQCAYNLKRMHKLVSK